MSHIKGHSRGESVASLKQKKLDGKKISMVTCYDAAFARIIDGTAIDMVLVGDSLGNVVLGYESTISVKLAEMIHHAAAVRRALKRPFLVVDMPFMTYQVSIAQALEHAGQLVALGGAQAVKLEGGKAIVPQVEAIVAAGIPVMGHIGFTPQSLHALSGYKVQGTNDDSKRQIIEDALLLQQAGVFSIVLEMIPKDLAAEISKLLHIPTIGVGAGAGCDGQVLVLHDLLGFDSQFKPKFVKKFADLDHIVRGALEAYDHEVKNQVFPSDDFSY